MTVRILGPVTLERSGAPVTAVSPKLRSLLGVLASQRGSVVSASRLREVLWGEDPPPAAAATLQSHLSRLRRLLAPDGDVVARGSGYGLELPDGTVDAEEFVRLAAQARGASDAVEAVRLYAAALAWWRGPALGDLAWQDWMRAEAVRLDELRQSATEEWVERRLEVGGDPALVGDLEGLTAAHPLRERYTLQLMVALYRTGRQADALRRATELRTRLGEELGLDVSPALRALETRILADDPALLAAPPATERPRARPPVADDPTPLVGRDVELQELARAVRQHRLVTLVGPGGVGKTRLARRLAATADDFEDGAAVVELAAVRDATAVADAVATALDVQQRQHLTVDDTLLVMLGSRHELLVLDNCEHLLDAVVPFVEGVRTRCHRVHVVATSREPLGLPGEVVWPIVPLEVAAQDVADAEEAGTAPAVQLLVERASAALPGFTLDAANAPVIAELCRRLDGLPLALELAAARFRSLAPEDILERLGPRSRLLDAGTRSSDARHRTLRDTVDWSYELLGPAEQVLFTQLSVFAGSFDLDAVRAVCDAPAGPGPDGDRDAVEVLVALVDKSMVQVVDHVRSRYQLLETLRAYGRERLEDAEGGAAEARSAQHLRWYTTLAGRVGEGLAGPEEAAWSRRVEADFDNFRAAHAWAVATGDVDAALRLVAGLREYAFRRIRYELTGWAAAATQLPGAAEHPSYPVVLATVAYGHFVRGDLQGAIDVAHQAVAAQEAMGVPSSGLAERSLGNAIFYMGRTDEALLWMDRMVASARANGGPGRLAHALYMRSVAETSVGRTVRGAVMAGEAQAAARAGGSPTALAQAAYALGVALERTEPAASLQSLRQAAALAKEGGNRWVEAFAQTEVSWLEARMGDDRRALTSAGAVIETWHRGGDWVNLWLSVRHLFGILHQMGDHRAAAVVHGALSAAGVTDALPFEPSNAERVAAMAEELRETLGGDGFDRAVADGGTLSEAGLVGFVQERIAALTSTRPEP